LPPHVSARGLILHCSVPRRTFQRRVALGGGAETFRAVLSSAELSRAETCAGS